MNLKILLILPFIFLAGCGGGGANTQPSNPPQISLSTSTNQITEGSTALITLTATTSVISTEDIVLNINSSGTATKGVDYNISTTTITIVQGTSSAIATISIIDDQIYEGNETIISSISISSGSATVNTSSLIITIIDNEQTPQISLSTSTNQITEGSTALITLTATTSVISTEDIVLNINSSGTATKGVDYNISTTTITIVQGTSFAIATISIIDDQIYEGNETINILSVDATVNTNSLIITIIDNEQTPQISLSTSTNQIIEGSTASITLTATTSVISTEDIVLNINSSGTATKGVDYNISTTTITIVQGTSSAIATISIIDDQIYEGNETINILSVDATVNTNSLIITIIDNEQAPQISLSTSTNQIIEGSTALITLTATTSVISTEDIVLNINSSGTATKGVDYNISTTTITIVQGTSSAIATISIIDDQIYEGNETIISSISISSGSATVNTSSLIITIIDNEQAPQISLSTSTNQIIEGSTALITLTATTSVISTEDIVLNINSSGTATKGVDYNISTTTITIVQGTSSAIATISIIDDQIYEGNETIISSISISSGSATVNTSSLIITIIDNEQTPQISLSTSTNQITEGSTALITLTATTSVISTEDIVLNINSSGTATKGVDYNISTTTITIVQGTSSAIATISIIDDQIYEGNETIISSISISSGSATVNTSSLIITIIDNEQTPQISLSTSTNQITEGSTALITLTATTSVISTEDIVLNINSSGTATKGVDYNISTTTITIAQGTSFAIATISIIDDQIYEGNETINILSVDATVNTNSLIITIIDNEQAPQISLSTSTNQITEGSTALITLTATTSVISTEDIVLNINSSGTATKGVDYNISTTTITIAQGTSSAIATISIIDDQIYEGNETINILSVDATVNTNSLIITIIDNEQAPQISLSTSTNQIIEGSTASITLTATTSVISTEDIVLNINSSGTATKGVDYNISTTTITIVQGTSSAIATISIIDDQIYEGNETIISSISISSGSATVNTSSLIITIIDNEQTPQISLSTSTNQITEGSTALITLTATTSVISTEDIVLNINSSGTATKGVDYNISTTTITIVQGTSSAIATISIIDDQIYEGNETIISSISISSGSATVNTSSSIITIIDNEVIALTTSLKQITEDSNATITLTVNTSFIAYDDIEIELIAVGSAIENVDYSISATTITIAQGTSSATATISIIDDQIYEVNETIIYSSKVYINDYYKSVQGEAIIIVDNEVLSNITLNVSSNQITEDSTTTITLTAITSVISTEDIVVNISSSGTATKGVDYNISTTTITIAKGTSSATTTINIIDDLIYEGDETIVSSILSVSSGNVIINGNAQSQTIIINDNESPPLEPKIILTSSANSIYESSTNVIIITAILSKSLAENVIIDISTSGTATEGDDYYNIADIVIEAGQTYKEANFTPISDSVFEGGVETAIISVAGISGGAIQSSTQSITIVINERELNSGVQLTYDSSKAEESLISEEFRYFNYYNNVLYNNPNPNPLEMINAHKVYGYGLSGKGQTIAIMDTGFFTDHIELADKTIEQYGTLTATSSSNFHGTFVASVATGSANNIGMHGVAMNADLHIADFRGATNGDKRHAKHWADATNDASSAVVQNNSWGYNITLNAFKDYVRANGWDNTRGVASIWESNIAQSTAYADADSYIKALNDFQDHGVIVYAISNDDTLADVDFQAGLPELFPELEEAWITAVNIEVTGTDTYSYERKSAPCGSTARYCLGGDGWDVLGAGYDNGDINKYYIGSGTSFVAPQVSGAVALLAEAFPNHKPDKLTDRLLASANNLFFIHDDKVVFGNGVEHGFNAEFGHGFMDIYAALQPITMSNYTRVFTGNSLLDLEQSYKLGTSKIASSSSLGDAIYKGLLGEIGYSYDDLNGGFAYDMTSHISSVANNSLAINLLSELYDLSSPLNNVTNLSWKDNFNNMLMLAKVDDDFYTAFTINTSSLPVQSFFGDNVTSLINLLNYKVPYLESNEGGIGISAVYKLGNSRFMVGVTSPMKHGIDDIIGVKKTFATSLEYKNPTLSATLIGGLVEDNDNLLGLTGSNAFSFNGSTAKTKFSALQIQSFFTKSLTLSSIATIANTNMTSPNNSFINVATNVKSSSIGLIVNKSNLFGNDNMSFFIKQPNRVDNGAISMRFADLADTDDNINYTVKDILLEPSGRQLDYGVSYRKNVSDNTSFAFKHVVTKDLNHNSGAKINYSNFIGISYKDLKVGVSTGSDKSTIDAKILYSFNF